MQGQLARPNELSKGAFCSDMSEEEQKNTPVSFYHSLGNASETPLTYATAPAIPTFPIYYMLRLRATRWSLQ